MEELVAQLYQQSYKTYDEACKTRATLGELLCIPIEDTQLYERLVEMEETFAQSVQAARQALQEADLLQIDIVK